MTKFELINALATLDDDSEISFILTDGDSEYYSVDFRSIDNFGIISLSVDFDEMRMCLDEFSEWEMEEPSDIDSDFGFDPYMGCFSDDV